MSDLFSGLGSLGGLMKGLGSLMPQDDPGAQLLKAQGEVSELKKQEKELYEAIGRKAVEQYGMESFEEEAQKLGLIQSNLVTAQAKVDEIKKAEEEKARAEEEARAARTCKECGHENPEGTKFCQQCGTKMGARNLCPSCGAENAPGVKFCQQCGTKMEAAPEPESGVCPSCNTEYAEGTKFCCNCGTRL